MNVSYSTVHTFTIGNTEMTIFPSDETIKGSLKTHAHCHLYYELLFILSGTCIVTTDRGSHTVPAECAVIIPPNLMHGVIDTEGSERFCITFLIKKTNTSPTEHTFENLFYKLNAINQITVIEKSYAEFLSRIITHVNRTEPYYLESIKHWLSLLFLELTKSLPDTPIKTEHVENQMSDHCYKAMVIERYIGVCYNKPDASLSQLANLLCLSTKQTSRTVRELTGLNFKELLLRQRMHLAKELIEDGEMKMYEIAAAVGYHSYEIFYKAFSKYYNKAPTAPE